MDKDHASIIRREIKDGTTISNCIERICDLLQTDNAGAVEALVEVFALRANAANSAFGAFGMVDEYDTQRGLATLSLLYEIVRRKDAWNNETSAGSCWFDLLHASSRDEIANKANESIENSDWEGASDALRQSYLTIMRSYLQACEKAEIVARLAERLQRKVAELEIKLQEKTS